jgi:hypothetical protein
MTGLVSVSPSVAQILIHDRHLFGLMLFLRVRHDLESEFTVADTLAPKFKWPLRQLREARRRAVAGGWLVLLEKPKRSRPARYTFGKRCWRDLPEDSGADKIYPNGGE